ncbi:MAG: hypothetical protein CVT72_01720 [Alphaproteobacteria bacterium HGW-Alphaproteobacteria-11]|nr:MAG: hypothetical protein CVT72_01720 [Alphaproteobacteria bacterium HGW-Alphaproteobacteria-11]
MHLRRYTHDYSRRLFLERLAAGVVSLGVTAPLWPVLAATGDASRAYPDELLSIDAYTKGAISTGGRIDAGNVDLVKELLDPIRYRQIKEMGRILDVVAPTTELMELSPWEYLEATLRNSGRARFDARGNVVTEEGEPWIGGNPFPNPKSAIEIFAGLTLSWGRHDISVYATKEFDLAPNGVVDYRYESVWAELAPVGRVAVEPMPYWPEFKDKLRFQSVAFTFPNEEKGTSFLNIWPYDQNEFPELYGYLPAFKRIRRFPTNQRFEPLIAGSTLYLSDAWAAGDPLLTWGNYRLVHQGPALVALSGGWEAGHPNWEHTTHGGPHGDSFWDTKVQLVPEALVVEAEPVMFPRAPVGKKQVWFDARTLLPFVMVSYDRKGEVFRSFDGAFSQYRQGDTVVMDGKHPYWSWTHVHAHNIQTNRITRLEQVRQIRGGHTMMVNDQSAYDRYLTTHALRRLGM